MVRISPESFDFGNPEIGCNSSVDVEISNVGLAPLEIGWFHNPALQAIVFDLSHIPEVGDEIDIEYAVSGECGD